MIERHHHLTARLRAYASKFGPHDPEHQMCMEAVEALAARQEGEWLPIETAPTAETMILGYQATPGDHEKQMGVCWSVDCGENGFVWIGVGGLTPTHWRPLPAPPTS